MYYYINVHSALNQMRIAALKNKTLGPNILITGSTQSGKSTLCRILTNYSLKLGWTPMLCDLDLNYNEISPPGCIAAALVEEPLPNDDLIQSSLSFFHGNNEPFTLEFLSK
jgi:polyribonucleotide 5'-hydroxyl-kinase